MSRVRLKIDFATAQLQGRRLRQEDSFLTRHVDEGLIAVVADGLGGHDHGDEASFVATSSVISKLEDAIGKRPKARADALRSAVWDAHGAVSTIKGYGPPATTLIAALFMLKRRRFQAVYVGDSLCYRLRGGNLEKLFNPQLFGWGLAYAVGYKVGISGEGIEVLDPAPKLEPGDRFLLASDGIEVISAEDISAHMALSTARDACEAMIQQVLSKRDKNQDNVTLIVVFVDQVKQAGAQT